MCLMLGIMYELSGASSTLSVTWRNCGYRGATVTPPSSPQIRLIEIYQLHGNTNIFVCEDATTVESNRPFIPTAQRRALHDWERGERTQQHSCLYVQQHVNTTATSTKGCGVTRVNISGYISTQGKESSFIPVCRSKMQGRVHLAC